jgi:hypothetical protein
VGFTRGENLLEKKNGEIRRLVVVVVLEHTVSSWTKKEEKILF